MSTCLQSIVCLTFEKCTTLALRLAIQEKLITNFFIYIAMATIQEMLSVAKQIKEATEVGENTAVRVGTEIYDIVAELSRMLVMMDDKLENDAVVKIVKSELAKITITQSQIADEAITGAKLAYGSVKNRNLASICVTGDKIQPGAVKHNHLAENCISEGNIINGSVTAKKLGTNIYMDIANRVTNMVTTAITAEEIDALFA